MNLYEDQGHTAYNSGQTEEECPYAEGTDEAQEWLKGWGTARDVSETPRTHKIVDGTHYHLETPDRVVKALEQARKAQCTVRIFLGDVMTGVAWTEEHDVCGRISRSMGPVKVPILINNRRSMGGTHILDHCIVGIIMRDRSDAIQWLYRHNQLDLGKWTAHSEDVHTGERARAEHNGKAHAYFDTFERAVRYCAFMKGERIRK